MIVLDADVLLIDLRYRRDVRFPVNRQALDQLAQQSLQVGITCHTLLEVLGACTFNVSPSALRSLVTQIPATYRLTILPDPLANPAYAGGLYADILDLIATRLSLGDSITALQLAAFFPAATLFMTWNARHFVGKLAIPVLTPEEWLQQNPAAP